jgi:hypothetical protein
VLALEEKLGPILWQLPPQLAFDGDRLATFLACSCAHDARRGARRRAATTSGSVTALTSTSRPTGRSATRSRSGTRRSTTPAFLRVLRRFDVACCVADTAGRWPALDAVTADFVYVRLHGDKRLYVSGYGRAALDDWAARIARWRGRRPRRLRLLRQRREGARAVRRAEPGRAVRPGCARAVSDGRAARGRSAARRGDAARDVGPLAHENRRIILVERRLPRGGPVVGECVRVGGPPDGSPDAGVGVEVGYAFTVPLGAR